MLSYTLVFRTYTQISAGGVIHFEGLYAVPEMEPQPPAMNAPFELSLIPPFTYTPLPQAILQESM